MADERRPVALNPAKGGDVNTLVLAGLDLVFPLEADLDNDPESDDVVRLWSDDGFYDRSLSRGDPDVEREGETSVLAYTFRDVPPGIYRLSLVVKGGQVDILRDLVVTRTDILHGGKPLGSDYDPSRLGTPDESVEEDSYDPDSDNEIDESFYGLEND